MDNSQLISLSDQEFISNIIEFSSNNKNKENTLNEILKKVCQYFNLVKISIEEKETNQDNNLFAWEYTHENISSTEFVYFYDLNHLSNRNFIISFFSEKNVIYNKFLLNIICSILAFNITQIINYIDSKVETREKEFINNIYSYVTSKCSVNEILGKTLKNICEFHNMSQIAIYKFNEDNPDIINLIHDYNSFDSNYFIEDIEVQNVVTAITNIKNGQSHYCNDISILSSIEKEFFNKLDIKSYYAYPIFSFGVPNHFIVASSNIPNKILSQRDLDIFENTTHILETTVIRQKIEQEFYEERKEKLREQEFLNEIYNVTTRIEDCNTAVTIILDKMCNFFNLQGIYIYGYDEEETNEISLTYAFSNGNYHSPNTILIKDIETTFRAIKNGKVFFCPEAAVMLPSDEISYLDSIHSYGHCAVPLKAYSVVNRFIVGVSDSTPINWTKSTLNLFVSIAHILETTVVKKDLEDTFEDERQKAIVEIYRAIAESTSFTDMIQRILSSIRINLSLDCINVYEVPIFEDFQDGKVHLTYSDFKSLEMSEPITWFGEKNLLELKKEINYDLQVFNLLEKQYEFESIINVCSIAFVPLFTKKELIGFSTFIHREQNHIWTENEKITLEIAANIIQTSLERKRTEIIMYHKAYHDALLDIPNRLKFKDDMTSALEKGKEGTIIFFDIDNFKNVNDTYGHTYGDLLLIQVCKFLKTLKTNFYRFGGDEFIIILDTIEQKVVSDFCLALLNRFRLPWQFGEHSQYCTASIGVAMFPTCGSTVDDIVKNSDIAMFKAKQGGKDNVSFFTSDVNKTFLKRVRIEECMRKAIANNFEEFEIYYQPIMDIKTGTCSNLEALLRWNSQELGFVMPDEFIPLAEYLNLIVPLGEWVLYNACLKSIEWEKKFNKQFKINVNVSHRQLQSPTFIERVRQIISEVQIRSGAIVLEITETIDPRDVEFITDILIELRSLGLAIAMDDFGTGYSSLSNFISMPVDIVKIDKSFITHIASDDMQAAFVKSITELSINMKKSVCIEGVETDEQLNVLKNMGNVTSAQGYNFSRPLTCNNFEKWYIENF